MRGCRYGKGLIIIIIININIMISIISSHLKILPFIYILRTHL